MTDKIYFKEPTTAEVKDQIVLFKVSKTQKLNLKERAQELQVNPSEYCRSVLFDKDFQ